MSFFNPLNKVVKPDPKTESQLSTTMRQRHGSDFYQRIGRMGGMKSRGGGFGSMKLGKDGLTGPQRASLMGKKHGRGMS